MGSGPTVHCTGAWHLFVSGVQVVQVVQNKCFLSARLYLVVVARKAGQCPPNVGDALADVVKQFLNLGPKLGHSEDVEERGDSTGEDEVDVISDVVMKLDIELLQHNPKPKELIISGQLGQLVLNLPLGETR